jgi:hypothetical protein
MKAGRRFHFECQPLDRNPDAGVRGSRPSQLTRRTGHPLCRHRQGDQRPGHPPGRSGALAGVEDTEDLLMRFVIVSSLRKPRRLGQSLFTYDCSVKAGPARPAESLSSALNKR